MDQLKVVGIDSRGYGKIYKIVMRDPLLPLISKAIYAYLCSYAGSGTTAFPGREKILHDLAISKNTYTKYLGALVKAGYLTRTRTASGNLYEIRTSVPDKDGEQVEAKAKGFGTVPKLAMLDTNLTAQAKALYAYLCSYAGSGSVAYPHRKTITRELSLGLSAYYAHYNALVVGGYITPVQTTSARGRFGVAEYCLNDLLGVDPSTGLSTSLEPPMLHKATHGEKSACHAGFEVKSQMPIHGENTPSEVVLTSMSQMSIRGEKMDFEIENIPQIVENTKFSTNPQTAMSQEPMSRESVHRYLGHANNNNIPYKKQILSMRVSKQKTSAQVQGDTKHHPTLSKSEIKVAIGYERIAQEIASWTALNETLGNFPGEIDRYSYQNRALQLLKGMVDQLYNIFRRTAEVIMVAGQPYSRMQLCETLTAHLSYQAMSELFFSLIDKLPQIRSIDAYMQTVLLGYAAQKLIARRNDFPLQG